MGSRAILQLLPPHPLHPKGPCQRKELQRTEGTGGKAGDAVRKTSREISYEHEGRCVCEAFSEGCKGSWSVSYVKYVVRPRSEMSRDECGGQQHGV